MMEVTINLFFFLQKLWVTSHFQVHISDLSLPTHHCNLLTSRTKNTRMCDVKSEKAQKIDDDFFDPTFQFPLLEVGTGK